MVPLEFDHFEILSFFFEKFVMGPLFYDCPLFSKDNNLVSFFDGLQSMSCDNHCSSEKEFVECLRDFFFSKTI